MRQSRRSGYGFQVPGFKLRTEQGRLAFLATIDSAPESIDSCPLP
jgi:hypothetical protein